MAVSLALRPKRAILNDANQHLMNFYLHLQSGFEIPEMVPLLNNRQAYLRNRSRLNELIETGVAGSGATGSAEAAALFYYLNRTGYNGLCRFNKRGLYNVPFGSYKSINYRTDFEAFRATFRSWKFKTGDFTRLRVRSDDLIYADPPYDVQFTSYSPGGFDWDDQVRLVQWLDRHSGPVLLSNQATDRIVELYTSFGYNLRYLRAPRRISCTGDREPVWEILATRGI
jgi:DNA adenine methylase